jgi:hypothetical protein
MKGLIGKGAPADSLTLWESVSASMASSFDPYKCTVCEGNGCLGKSKCPACKGNGIASTRNSRIMNKIGNLLLRKLRFKRKQSDKDQFQRSSLDPGRGSEWSFININKKSVKIQQFDTSFVDTRLMKIYIGLKNHADEWDFTDIAVNYGAYSDVEI